MYPLDGVPGEQADSTFSASSELARVLGRNPIGEPSDDAEVVGPVETRDARRAPTPLDPTTAEVENHKLTGHAVFRSWCRHCVRGRGREAPHSSIERPASSLPILSWDYCFLSSKRASQTQASSGAASAPAPAPDDSGDGRQPDALESPVLVMYDSKGKGIHARLMPAKGIDFEGFDRSLKLWAGDLDRLGYKRVTFRSDTEISIVSFLRELRNYWQGEVVPEKAATGDPQSNGAAEVGVQLLKAHIRTQKDALEHNLGVPILSDHGILTLLVRYAAATYRRYAVGADGKTPDERTTGRKSNPAVAEFGEAVWWMPLQTTATQLPPLGARFEEGYYVGLADGSAESLILTPTGLVKCRSVRRRPLSERWSQAILETTASELQPNSLRPGEARIGIRAPVHIEPVPCEPPAFQNDPKARAPRQTQLLRSDFAGPGLTPGCPGCDVIRRKSNEAARHSDACR